MEKTVLKALGQCSFTRNGDPAAIDVKDGKILRIRPLHFEDKYTKEEIKPWRSRRTARSSSPRSRATWPPTCSPTRSGSTPPTASSTPSSERWTGIPNGGAQPQNRGKSKYMRITWDEATDLIADEIRRVRETYGPYAVLCHGDGHGETKMRARSPRRARCCCMEKSGGYTQAVRNADSWEGWYWGAEHVWGEGEHGLMPAGRQHAQRRHPAHRDADRTSAATWRPRPGASPASSPATSATSGPSWA